MDKHKGQFPEGWNYAQIPDHYYYKGVLVKRIDRGRGMIELVARKDNCRYSVLGKGLRETMLKMEKKLKNKLT